MPDALVLGELPPSRVTMEDVANAANVSKAAVSSFLSGRMAGQGGKIGIGATKRQLILQTARKLGYRPQSPQALLKIYPEQGHYCFLMSRQSRDGFDNYFSEIFHGIMESLVGDSLNVNIAQFEVGIDYVANPDQLPYAVQSGMTTKYVLVGSPNYSLLMSIIQRGYHAIYLSRIVETTGLASVAPDYEQAAYLGVRRLIEAGHRRVGIAAEHYWSFDQLNYQTPRLRSGAVRALREAGLMRGDGVEVFIPHAGEPADPAETYAPLFHDRGSRPTGVFCFCDYTARRVARAASAAGLSVPADLSIVGCQDEPLSREMAPALTTIHFPLAEMGRMAVQHLKSIDRGETPENTKYVLPVALIERGTVAPPR